jgi:hypothetical protein
MQGRRAWAYAETVGTEPAIEEMGMANEQMVQAPGLSLGGDGALVWPTAPNTYSIKNFLQAGIIQHPQAPAAEFSFTAVLQASQGPIG